MRSLRPTSVILALALLAAACGGSAQEETTTTEAPTTTTTSATTTSTTTTTTTTTLPPTPAVYDGPIAPLTGLPIEDEAWAERRVVAVKIDNHPGARPQSGLDLADAMIEIRVEGGFTRFLALFHTTDTDYVGPVRSARPTDASVLRPLGAVLVLSGAQQWVMSYLSSRGIKLIGEVAGSGLFRIRTRPAPHNLFGNTWEMRVLADQRSYPDEFGVPLYEVAAWETMPDEEAEAITISWSDSNTIVWRYEDGRYLRYLDRDIPHQLVDAEGEATQIGADVLVAIGGRWYTATPNPGARGNPVPAIETVGSGPVTVFADGYVKTGTWQRDSIEEPFTFLDADGVPFTVPPGRPWISVYPKNRDISW